LKQSEGRDVTNELAPERVTQGLDDRLLRVEDLRTEIHTRGGRVRAVDGVSFAVKRGETVGLVGESGSGKTTACLSIMRLMPSRSARIVGGAVWFDGVDLMQLSNAEIRAYRGNRISLITQDALAALNPVLTIGDQVTEPLRRHLGNSRSASRLRAVDMMESMQVPHAVTRLRQYPHQLSGGTRQRVVASMSLIAGPELLIADEPTTALDVTTQARFLGLIREIQANTGLAVIWVTHDLGVAAQICDRINVMYAGRIVESGDVRRIFQTPMHPYTVGLMKSVPVAGAKQRRLYQINGQPPDLTKLPPGCPFAPRCEHAMDICHREHPPVSPLGDDGFVSCWLASTGLDASPQVVGAADGPASQVQAQP
jgi:peptide/nickel transport system ATP-binding protein